VHAAHGDVDPARMPPARFTLEGELEPPAEGGEAWPNFQLDCYGTWLWALNEHVERGGELTEEHRAAGRVVSEYLQAAGTAACFDCWEEHPGFRHTSTLAAVVAGLRGAARLLDEPSATAKADAVIGLLGAEHTLAGAYVRSSQDTRVDASLLWLVVPYDVVELEDPIMRATIERVRSELTGPTGGLRRYLGDTFYGGSEWILTAASLALVDLRRGDRKRAEAGLAWIEAQATSALELPEHVPHRVQSPHMLDYWRERWGPPTCPLLWSHAMHLLLDDALARQPDAT